VRTGADQVVIPTTYAGSEMTDILGETSGGEKVTRRDPAIRPEVVICDVDLTLTLPVGMTATSALNAIAHGMEALYAPDRNPVIVAMVKEALPAFRDALPVLARDPGDRAARAGALYAAWCCSTALGYVSMALHHKLAHVLGGSFDTPHAETHAILLPHTTAFNEAAAREALAPDCRDLWRGIGGGGPVGFCQGHWCALAVGGPGPHRGRPGPGGGIALRNSYDNPRPFTERDIRDLLQAAWEGRRPQP
jgi:maleylacetate reductase